MSSGDFRSAISELWALVYYLDQHPEDAWEKEEGVKAALSRARAASPKTPLWEHELDVVGSDLRAAFSPGRPGKRSPSFTGVAENLDRLRKMAEPGS